MEWRPILRETNTSPDVVCKLQSALPDAGFNPGAIDGSLSRHAHSKKDGIMPNIVVLRRGKRGGPASAG
ncbi:MAG: hypothetical protein JNM75_02045 [Rhodospirillales bacterium]|nr:hypothetical protein [Rhodospirillales bacterium]